MTPKNRIKRLIEQHGVPVSTRDGSMMWRAFVQPLRYKNKLYVEESALSEGMINRTAYRYIGPTEVNLGAFPRGTVLLSLGAYVTVAHQETIYYNNEPAYVYAVLNFYSDAPAA